MIRKAIFGAAVALAAWFVAVPAGADGPVSGQWRPAKAGPQVATLSDSVALSGPNIGAGRASLLYNLFPDGLQARNQGRTPACVGFAFATAIDVLQAQQIYGLGQTPAPLVPTDPLSIFAFSRYEVAHQTHNIPLKGKFLWLDRELFEGSLIPWAVEAVAEHGCLPQGVYGEHDLRSPTPADYDKWGMDGVPDELEATASRFRVLSYGRCRSYEQVRAALYYGWPVVLGTELGFARERDEDGFIDPIDEDWGHAMVFIGYAEHVARPGACIMNSWGPDWATGPNRLGAPDGSFWVTPATVDRIIQRGACYYLGRFTGFCERPTWRYDQ